MAGTWYRMTIGVTLILGTGVGCGSSLPPKANVEQARGALTKALDAWKKQERPSSLTQERPPIYFNDSKWKDGVKLLAYRLETDSTHFGQGVRLQVSLTLESAQGMAKERQARYLVDTGQAIVIVPD